MTDTLEVFGREYTGVAGIKATDDNGQTKTYIRPQGNLAITANSASTDVSQYATVSVSVPSGSPTLQTKTYNVSSAGTATVTADSGYDGLSSVSVSVPSATITSLTSPTDLSAGYDFDTASGTFWYWAEMDEVFHPITQSGYISTASTFGVAGATEEGVFQLPTQSATTITPTTSSQTAVTAGKYTTGAVTVAAMPTGTAGTPTATKGTVSNHSISVTPSVTNTTGYISGGTKTGTAVTVSASELVSGSETKTANGTYDVTNLASVVVAIPIQHYYTGSSAPSSSLGADGDIYLKTS